MCFLWGYVLSLRHFRGAQAHVDWNPKFQQPKFLMSDILTRDKVKLRGYISEALDATAERKKVMLLPKPLGQCGASIYAPIFAEFGSTFVYIMWDYRGFFGSQLGSPERLRPISVSEHAQDAIEVLRYFGCNYVDVVVGHSMGVAVALDLVLLHPKQVGSLILLNGFHGDVFQTGFQPLFRIPFAGDAIGFLVETLLSRPMVLQALRPAAGGVLDAFLRLYVRLFGSPLLAELLGPSYLFDFMEAYVGGLCDSEENVTNWLRMFQELDAHSVYHLLPSIKHPVLIISGFLDLFTPPMQSVEMARRLPNAIHYCDPCSSHASILESPEWCLAEISFFVKRYCLAGELDAAATDAAEGEPTSPAVKGAAARRRRHVMPTKE